MRLDLAFKLALSVLLGGAIGLEREISGKPAGLRTNILICLGSALLMDLSIQIGMLGIGASEGRVGDPGRIAAQIVSGIGFLGAGTILQARGAVLGLTTAATIWVVAAIGMTIGAGYFIEASGAAIMVALVLAGLGSVEKRILAARRTVNATIRVVKGTPFTEVESILRGAGILVQSRHVFEHADDRTLELRLFGPSRQFDAVSSTLVDHPSVLSVQLD